MRNPDVIGIGAINYDYMFHCKVSSTKNFSPDNGREELGRPYKEVEEIIKAHSINGNDLDIQIGGSALLALKAIHAIDKSLSIAFVGVCGRFNEFDKDELIDFVHGIPYVYLHHKISFFQTYNDTGVGDCFAGGFIAGLLSDRLIAQQPASIELGVLAAKARMTSEDNTKIYGNIEEATKNYFNRKYKNGRDSIRKRIVFFIKSHYKTVLSFISGAIASYIVGRILSIFF